MKTIWFKRTGFLYMPVHVMGVFITLIAADVSIFFFIEIDRQSHSASDTLIDFFVYFTCTAFW
jgi:hypothetical protein